MAVSGLGRSCCGSRLNRNVNTNKPSHPWQTRVGSNSPLDDMRHYSSRCSLRRSCCANCLIPANFLLNKHGADLPQSKVKSCQNASRRLQFKQTRYPSSGRVFNDTTPLRWQPVMEHEISTFWYYDGWHNLHNYSRAEGGHVPLSATLIHY